MGRPTRFLDAEVADVGGLSQAEIDLLKNLHHDNIVKYVGFVKSQDCLNIILE